MRRTFASAESAKGLSGSPSPVRLSTRMIVPDRPTGSSPRRRSWLRSEPPSVVGGASVEPVGVGGSPHAFVGEPNWPQSGSDPSAPSPPPANKAPLAGSNTIVPTEWLNAWTHQSSTSTWDDSAAMLDGSTRYRTRRPLAGHRPFAGHGSLSPPVPYSGASPPTSASRVYSRYRYGSLGHSGSTLRPSNPSCCWLK